MVVGRNMPLAHQPGEDIRQGWRISYDEQRRGEGGKGTGGIRAIERTEGSWETLAFGSDWP